jgi:hypothetical protein
MKELIVVSTQDMQRIECQIERRTGLRAMIEADPEVLALLKWAAAQRMSQSNVPNRWHLYREVKLMSKDIVGWDARTPELRTSACYETFIRAIDTLLPSDEEQSA